MACQKCHEELCPTLWTHYNSDFPNAEKIAALQVCALNRIYWIIKEKS